MKKINIIGIDENKEHWYLCSTNSAISCMNAITKFIAAHYKDSFKRNNVSSIKGNRIKFSTPVGCQVTGNGTKKLTQIYATYKD